MNCRPTADERHRALPGDGIVADAAGVVMHAVTIAAAPEYVWPWLVQMGSGRGGWYSYDWVDNDGRPSATQIIPEFQNLAVGDIMPSLPGATDQFVVAAIEPFRDLVLTVRAADLGRLPSRGAAAGIGNVLPKGQTEACAAGGARLRPNWENEPQTTNVRSCQKRT